MAIREIVQIDEDLCDGCGLCIPSCSEGALQIVDGKAKLVNDIFCDGFGDCLGQCPQGAITIIKREAEDFDEAEALEHVAKLNKDTVEVQVTNKHNGHAHGHTCPGSMQRTFNQLDETPDDSQVGSIQSRLNTWPVQLHLLNPNADFFKNANVLLCADCVPFALPDFHRKMLDGNVVAVGCPKLDQTGPYVEKLAHIIGNAGIKSLTVAVMEVPCCSGLLQITAKAIQATGKPFPVKVIRVGIKGDILSDDFVMVGQ